jgi:signal transduction histidine kinase
MNRGWGPPRGRRPPWWPENEPFPPRRWRRGPPAFVRLIGCLFVAVLGVAVLMGIAIGGLVGRFGFWPLAIPAALFVLFLGVASFGMRRFTRPMTNLIDAAQRIEAGDYSTRLPVWGSADLRSVARAFNSMSARLKAIDEQRRGFLADVTHELRTPLSVIRGQAEAIADGVYPGDAAHIAPILDATQTIDRLVEDLRTLVLTDAGNLSLNRESTDLAELTEEAAGSFMSQAEAAGLTLHTEVAGTIPMLDVDPARMRSVIGNLLSNAVRHTPAGGWITVALSSTAGQVEITVTDTGEGIPPELLPKVFERFVKGPHSTGSGLGLAIAHDIVAAHGGMLEIESSVGKGTTARVRLPVPQT